MAMINQARSLGGAVGMGVAAGDIPAFPPTITGQVEILSERAFRMADQIRDLETSIFGSRPTEVPQPAPSGGTPMNLSTRLAALESALNLISVSLGRLCAEV